MAKKQDDKSKAKAATDPHAGRFVRYCLIMGLVAVVSLAWTSLLTYSPADPPSPEAPYAAGKAPVIHNAAGLIGAYLAYAVRYWLGGGAYMALLFASVAAFILVFGGQVKDMTWRTVGVILLMASTSAAVYMKDPKGGADMVNGAAGVLGAGGGAFLLAKFGLFGGWLILVVVFCTGLLFSADHLVLQLPRWGKKAWENRPELPNLVAVLRPPQINAASASPDPTGLTRSPRAIAASPVSAGKALAKGAAKSGAATALKDGTPQAADRKSRLVAFWDKLKKPQTPDAKPDDKNAAPQASAPKPADKGALPAPAAPNAKPAAAVESPARPAAPVDRASHGAPVESKTPPAGSPKPVEVEKKGAVPAAPADTPARLAVSQKPSAAKPAEKPLAKASDSKEAQAQYKLPSADLLAEPASGYLESQEQQAAEKRAVLQQTLNDFNVEAQVVGHMTGPVITMFELSLAPGVKVAQIQNLADDIARALAVPGVRIVSPLPGRDTVGVEVPNMHKEIVRIKELMSMSPEAERAMHLPLYLGKDASGSAIVADLKKMPHMLIAGTTGSGKSVCINSIIMSVLLTRRPEEVRLILVDPKMVEMAAFENIPHLLCPIVNDMRHAEDILEWAATKMDERYEVLKEAQVKDIADYNRLGAEELYRRFHVQDEQEKARIPTRLPYYVIIIDELADLIMTSSKEVEGHIIRIAQKARAVGIHLILATQRPSVNVVTGLIKANMPCRIAFRVSSRQESRIVLDQNGAEVLLGRGDMLFLQPGDSNLSRAQGAYVDDSEIRPVVGELRKTGEPVYNAELMKINSGSVGEGGSGERDELFDQAVEVVLASQRGSVSLVQRRLQIGYSRASRIIDQMADAGVLGDFKGSQARECLLTLEDWQAQKANIAADQSGANSANGEPTSV